MGEGLFYCAFGVLVLVAVVFIRQLRYAFQHFQPPRYTSKLGVESELPSVTVCIPARNERHALTDCLEAVLASDYEKLEIIVLDDVSGDDTSSLIKSFAHEGVRFVQGSALPKGWLGKNHALQGLLEEASGSYVLFMDVDTRLAPQAIEHMVRYALASRASMVSVLPRREDGWRTSVVLSPLRYFWEIIFSRRRAPATASSAWLIRRSVLEHRFQGFTSFKKAIQPEMSIAAELTDTDEYRFLVGTSAFGVSYEKKWRSQLITSVRLLFPLLRSEIAVAIIATLDLLLLLAPSVALMTPYAARDIVFRCVAIALYILYAGIYGSYTRRVWKQGAWLGALLWPLIILQEATLLLASIVQYKRHTVKWKGRTIQPEVQS
ncbi:MAG TPA: glycosyltransferase family 2 protein [Dongiaceae bacterium]|nr:glycosyltransferase family 2 protein [Dongiaceae bacterium]